MADRRWNCLVLGLALCATAPCAVAEEAARGMVREARAFLQASPSRLHDLLLRHVTMERRTKPEWLLEQSHDDMDPEPAPGDDGLQLVLQEDRRDGAELLTLRHPLADLGPLRTYAGAGLNQAVYYADSGDGPALNNRRNRHRSLGGAAELGAELRFGERVNLTADVRWIDIDDAAEIIKCSSGLVAADPVTYGVSLGWRFR
jgi:hypothetical protein